LNKSFNKKERAFIEEVDKMPEPKGFRKWVEKTVFKGKYRMFFKSLGKGKSLGVCQACAQEDIELVGAKAGAKGKCPECKAAVIYRNIKHQQDFYDVEYCSILVRLSCGLLVSRIYRVDRQTNFVKIKYNFSELERQVSKMLSRGKTARNFYTRGTGWEWRRGYYGIYSHIPLEVHTFPDNIWIATNTEEHEYSQLATVVKKQPVNAIYYLGAYSRMPVIEYLIKLGFSHLVNILIAEYRGFSHRSQRILNCNGKTVQEVLRLHGKYFDYARKIKADAEYITALQLLQSSNSRISKESINFVVKHSIGNLDEEKQLVFKDLGIEPVIAYMASQGKEDDRRLLVDYADYYFWIKTLGYDLRDTMYLKPRNFQAAHDRMMVEYKEHLGAKKHEKFKEIYPEYAELLEKYKGFKFVKDGFAIVAPQDVEAIDVEAKALKNCLANYVERVYKGSAIILFVRKAGKENESFAALELNPRDWRIVQCRTFKDKSIIEDAAIKKFLKAWMATKVFIKTTEHLTKLRTKKEEK